MADGQGGVPPPDARADSLGMETDWLTIWQSELSAMITDREIHDALLRGVASWADTARRMARLFPHNTHEHPAGRAGAAAAPRSTAVVAAPDDRDAAIRQLAERVAELERRLAERDASNIGSRP